MKFQSKFEKEVADTLDECGVNWRYEPYSYGIRTPIRGQVCRHCGEPLEKESSYTPDFFIDDDVFRPRQRLIECKGGSFKPTDQARYKRFVKQYPGMDFIIVFRANIRLRNLKGRPRVSEWGEKYGIPVLVGLDELRGWLV